MLFTFCTYKAVNYFSSAKYLMVRTIWEVQVVSWYDNENSYTSQMVRTIKYFAELK